MRNNGDLFLSATGILVGDGVRGEVLSLSPLGGDTGELFPRVAAAIKDLRSDKELLRFFLRDFTVSFFSSGGGEAPIVLSLAGCPCELEGLSSNTP